MSFKQPSPQAVTLPSLSLSVTVSFSMTQKADNTDLSELGHGLWLAAETSASLRTSF